MAVFTWLQIYGVADHLHYYYNVDKGILLLYMFLEGNSSKNIEYSYGIPKESVRMIVNDFDGFLLNKKEEEIKVPGNIEENTSYLKYFQRLNMFSFSNHKIRMVQAKIGKLKGNPNENLLNSMTVSLDGKTLVFL